MIEYAGIYLKNQSVEYARILNVSDAGFVELWHFHKNFVKSTRKRGPLQKHYGVFFS